MNEASGPASSPPLRIWVVTDGRPGNENPAKALAEGFAEIAARPCEIAVKRLALRPGFSLLPPRLWLAAGAAIDAWPFLTLEDRGASLAPPYPDLVIGAGRRSAPFTLAIKRSSHGRAVAAQILDPKLAPSLFDLVVTPAHDQLSGANVHQTIGSIHNVSPETLQACRDERLRGIGRPLIGVLVGGSSGAATLRVEDTDRLMDAIRPAAAAGAGVAATPSRRTSLQAEERLEAEIRGFGGFFWRGDGDNPYRAILAAADALVVTADSVNMASEAAGAGKPVFIAQASRLSPKLERFHRRMRLEGYTLELPNFLTLDVLARAATRRLDDRAEAAARLLKLIE